MTEIEAALREARLVTRENARWLALLLSPSHDPARQAKAREWADEWFDGLESSQRTGDAEYDAQARAALAATPSPALDVYADRNLVVQAYAKAMEEAGYQVAWGVDSSEPDWPVIYIETPHGQVSWHIPKAERIYEPEDRTATFGPVKWDGHTNADKADRLRAALSESDR